MTSDARRYFIPYVVGLAPALLVALTWSPAGDWTIWKSVMRGYALPIAGSELFVLLVALREGLLRSIPRWNWSRPALAAAVTLLAVATVTAALAPARSVAVTLTIYWSIHALFALAMAFLCGRVFAPKDLVRAYAAGFAVFAAQVLVYVNQIPDWNQFDWKNGFLAFTHIRHVGYYLAAMAGLCIGVMAIANSRTEWLWAWVLAAFAIGIALWTGSRGAALAIVGTLVVGMFIVPAMRSVWAWAGAISAAAAALMAVWLAPVAPSYLMGLTRAVEQTSNGDVTTGRTIIWRNVIEAIRHRPLFGYGEGQMHNVAPYSTMVQPHDSILQVTLAWGLVGLLCVLTLAIAFVRRAIPAVRHDQKALAPLFLAMTALASLSLYDGALYYALPLSIFAACGAVIASQWRGVSKTRQQIATGGASH
jgi:O-antigen ligase